MEKQKVGFVKFLVEYFWGDQLRQGVLVLIAGLVGAGVMLFLFNPVGAMICFGVAMIGLAHIGPRMLQPTPNQIYTISLFLTLMVTGVTYMARQESGRHFSVYLPAVKLHAWSGTTGVVEKIEPLGQELDFVTVWLSPSEARVWTIIPAARAKLGTKVRLSYWNVYDPMGHPRGFYLATPIPQP